MQTNTPNLQQFKQAQLVIQQLISKHNNKLDTNKGSVLRQLLVRPYAYVYTYINKLITNWLNRTSVGYLKNTVDTQDQIADLVASNYFVTRNQGRKASGQIIISLNRSSSSIPQYTKFIISSQSFNSPYVYMLGYTGQDTQTIKYIPTQQVDGQYKAIIAVQASQPGALQIIQGTPVQLSNTISNFQHAQVFSAISGGSDIQTNAQMMARCQAKCSGTLGTQRAITNRLLQAPVNVISCNCVGTAQPGQFRSSYNNLFIPAAGAVDVYVKTRNIPSKKQLVISDLIYNQQNRTYTFQINADQLDGFYTIENIRLYNDQQQMVGSSSYGSTKFLDCSIQYVSQDQLMDNKGARLSSKQKAIVTINKIEQAIQYCYATAQISYMPGISALQKYMTEDNVFIGQDILVKAAIPVKLEVSCQISSNEGFTDSKLDQIAEAIAQIINTSAVGKCSLNMADIQIKLQNKYPQVRLRLPYQMHCQVLTTQGLTYPIVSQNGILTLDSDQNSYLWDAAGYFIYTSKQNIHLQII